MTDGFLYFCVCSADIYYLSDSGVDTGEESGGGGVMEGSAKEQYVIPFPQESHSLM